MTSVLILYMSRGGHTPRIARRLCEHIGATGGRADMMPLVEAEHEGVDWNRYDVVVLGAPVLYGKYDGTEVKIDGEDLLILKESDVMGVILRSDKQSKAA